MEALENQLYTPAEYLAREEKALYRSEYRQGKIRAMAGGSLNHNRIAKNISQAIDNGLAGKSCESFMGDVRLWVQARNLYTYPDVMVICGEPQFAAGCPDTVTNPIEIGN